MRCKGRVPLSHLWPAHSCRKLFTFSFSTTPGILVSLLGHELSRPLRKSTKVGWLLYSTNLILVCDATRAASDHGCFI